MISSRPVIVGSEKIKKQMLVGFPGEAELVFNPMTNRYNERSRVSPLDKISICELETIAHEPEQVNS